MTAAESYSAEVSASAAALILSFEGMDVPWKWPGVGSGITLGHGFDLGFSTKEQFAEAWQRYLKPAHFTLLLTALGKTGQAAAAIASRFRGITLTAAEADDVFWRCTMPRWRKLTAEAFPGLEVLSATQEGVLVSLCFNRGTDKVGPRRREMANIAAILKRDISPDEKAKLIAAQIRLMNRLWPSNETSSGHPGLRRRRNAEAALMMSGT